MFAGARDGMSESAPRTMQGRVVPSLAPWHPTAVTVLPQRPALLSTLCTALALVAAAPARPTPTSNAAPWSTELRTAKLLIESRTRPGETLLEVRAVGTLAAPPAAVEAVVDDHGNYAAFMPSVTASRILSTDAAGRRLTHQVLSFPVVAPRDYVVWLLDESVGAGAQRVYRVRWRAAEGVGPAPGEGVVRMTRAEGFWQVEAGARPDQARVTYTAFSDPGGALPPWLVNLVNRGAIEAVFDAVERRAQARAGAP